MATDAREKKAAAKSAAAAAQEAEQLPCPRCSSSNTKFCYYNNYNFSQPRHFCKACRRYWTHGGTLRDIPVGGATRKHAKRSRTSTNNILPAAASAAAAAFSSAYHRDFRHLPAAASHLLAAGHGGAMGGSFTTLLNSSPATGLLAFGVGIDDVGGGFGLGRPAWPFAAVVDGGAAAHTWQMESGESGFVGGGGDCFGFPDLAISTPAGTFLK